MSIQTVGILSPGEMGSAVGSALRRNGLGVATCVEGRSGRTRKAAADSGFELVPDLPALVNGSDIVLSILVPAEAEGVASAVAAAIRSSGRSTLYADCNAVSPETARRMAADIEDAGGRYVDAGIIGGPPREGYSPRFYASGTAASEFATLSGKGIEVIPAGDRPGDASAVKMCYAAFTKGVTALQVSLLVAAARLGVYDALVGEFRHSQADALQRIERAVGRLPSVAYRWIGEMEEISATFESAGVSGDFHHGAAALFRLVAESPLAGPGAPRPALDQAVSALAAELQEKEAVRPGPAGR